MRKNTMTDLVVELEKLSPTPLRERLIEEAKKGSFHDFRSPAVCGKMYFVECAKWFYENIHKAVAVTHFDVNAMRVIEGDIKNGVYDEDLTDEDREFLKKKTNEDPNISEENKKFFFAAMGIK